MRHVIRRLWPLVGVLMLLVGVYIVSNEVRHHGARTVIHALYHIPPGRLALASACVLGSYLSLTMFDTLGLVWAGHPLPWRRAALASFIGLSIGHNVGLGGLGSGTLRWRVYSTWGLSLSSVARVVLFSGVTVGLGLAALGGTVLLVNPRALGVAPMPARALGAGALALVAAWILARPLIGRRVAVGRFHLATPPPRFAAAQVALGIANYLFEAGVLYQLLTPFRPPGYLVLVGIFVAATLAGLLSHAPGGLGVVETVVLALLPGADVIAALLAYRLLYFWIPGLAGLTCLAGFELSRRRRPEPQAATG